MLLKKLDLRWVVATSIVVLILATAWGGRDILSPVRRSVTPYEPWLQQPAKYGLEIENLKVEIAGVSVPFLKMDPLVNHPVGYRGRKIRQQVFGGERFNSNDWAGTCVLFHGHKGRKEFLIPVAERFCALGFRCLIPDLPAHGEHPLKQVHFGHGDGESDYLQALMSFAVVDKPVHVWGMSMGGAFAVKNVQDMQDEISSLTLVSTFTNLDEVMAAKIKSYAGLFGTGIYTMTRFFHDLIGGYPLAKIDNMKAVSQLCIPTLVVHGSADDFIPVSHGYSIYEGLQSVEKKFLSVDQAGHYDVLVTPQLVYKEMATWMLSCSD